MRRLWLWLYLKFNGIVTCSHPSAGLRYCPACDDDEQLERIKNHSQKTEKLRRRLAEWRR